MKTKIEFINHSSVKLSSKDTTVLCDPWYEGDAFNHGWSLLYINEPEKIETLLSDLDYIWISHEHPDHFSVNFFKKYEKLLKRAKTKIIFQETKDKRVIKYLASLELPILEISFNQKFQIGAKTYLTIFKDNFYDSVLLYENDEEKVLNVNDCEINTIKKAIKLQKATGNVDILLTQFSYAAWKGGKANIAWRKLAASEKISAIKIQAKYLSPKYIIPFASFIYFSNNDNYYLNDCINTPRKLLNELKLSGTEVKILKPHDIFSEIIDNKINIDFWDSLYENAFSKQVHTYNSVSYNSLQESFIKYISRIQNNNSLMLMKLMYKFKLFNVFNPINIFLYDLKIIVRVDLFSKTLKIILSGADLQMHSESLNNVFRNSFGFDTLTVNGCFEEIKKGGFSKATKTLSIENLNNLGIKFNLLILFNYKVIYNFLYRLMKVNKKLRLN